MAAYRIIDQTDNEDVSLIDVTSRHKWSWSWMDWQIVVHPDAILKDGSYKGEAITLVIGTHIRKVAEDSCALCTLCQRLLNYGNRGVTSLTGHLKSKTHLTKALISMVGRAGHSNDDTNDKFIIVAEVDEPGAESEAHIDHDNESNTIDMVNDQQTLAVDYTSLNEPGLTEITIPYETEVTIDPQKREGNAHEVQPVTVDNLNLSCETGKPKEVSRQSSSDTPKASSEIVEASHRHRKAKEPCPSLKREHINLLLIYLNNPDIVHEPLFLMQLKLSNFPRTKRYSVWKQMNLWSQYFCVRVVDGSEMLCLRATQKMVLPQERYAEVMRDAHEGVGEFKREQNSHNSFHKTFSLIEQRYGVTGREFGMSKFSVYEYVTKCTGCAPDVKRLPAANKMIASVDDINKSSCSNSDNGKNNACNNSRDGSKNNTNNTNSKNSNSGCANTSIDSSFDETIWLPDDRGDFDDPVSMIWEKPLAGSIWHNQRQLAGEPDPYSKLLGVIGEIGIDMTDSVQGNNAANTMFLTKLYCAQRLVLELKNRQEVGNAKKRRLGTIEKNSNNDGGCSSGVEAKKSLQCAGDDDGYEQLLSDYGSFEEEYVRRGELDVFLYDVNLLAMQHGLANDQRFMAMVNKTVRKFKPRDIEEPGKFDFDAPIDLVGVEL